MARGFGIHHLGKRSRRSWLRLASSAGLLICLLLPVCPAVAGSGRNGSYALIFGTLWGPGQRPIYGVRMKLRRAGERRFRWEAISDHRGEFAFRVPPANADYILVPDIKPTKDKPVPETSIHVEGDERVDVGVHLEP